MAGTRAGSFASQQIGPGARAPGLFDIVLISCLFVCLLFFCVYVHFCSRWRVLRRPEVCHGHAS